ncbi:MAG TPA: hypothetical protein VFQ32_09440, partial [Ktedonobacterales bacterium]|nr:hypothetical protein [Ktedonobacterales bacterium]
MDTLLQAGLAQVAIALSAFNLITFLWLGLMVLLLGDRRSLITWVGGIGLLLAALFFLCHGALVGAGLPSGASPSDVWWRVSWLPAFVAPLFWAATGLHYAGLAGVWRSLRLPLLGALAALGALTVLLALLYWPALAHYGDFIRLLDASLRLRQPAPPPADVSPVLPALGLAFVVYIAACACLPWVMLVARRLLPDATQRDGRMVSDETLLWDPGDAWSRARNGLIGASLCMMAAGAVVAGIGALVLLSEHRAAVTAVTGSLPIPSPTTRPGHVPIILVGADLVVQCALAGLGLTLGRAVLRQGILVERRLPQRGYLSHWRGMALVAGVLAGVVAWMTGIEAEVLPDLLLLVALITIAYAAVTWQSFAAHDRLLAQLRPFIASLTTGQASWLATDPHEIEGSVEALFTSLCRDVLGASRGRLALTAGRLHRTFTYAAPPSAGSDPYDRQEWSLPVRDERGVVAHLVLGPRVDGAGYTSADLEVARACGQRILDAVGEFMAAQAIASLARRRGLEAELSAALPRRVLHDEVLPRLHLAMLRLEALRARIASPVAEPAGAPSRYEQALTDEDAPHASDELEAVVHELGQAHHDLAALMRAAPIANTKKRHLEHGLVSALRATLDGEFRGAFDEVRFDAPEDARVAADALTPIVADLLLGAVQESLRNANRHGRGGDLHRRLAVRLALAADERWVSVSVGDDGVGLQSNRERDGQAHQQMGDQ